MLRVSRTAGDLKAASIGSCPGPDDTMAAQMTVAAQPLDANMATGYG